MDVSPARFEDGSLVYDVAGAHLAYDGSVFKGTYDLVMSSSVARCLYQFSSAPIKATISIIAADGSVQNIATEVVGERNGWLTLSANNFTFSAPTIKIKLFQDAPAKPAVNKSVTISCVKGKITKKVTGISPKCPSGFKKK
jgi:phage baseplate assembly protein gpV